MPTIRTVPLASNLAAQGASFAAPNLNAKQRLAILIQSKIVLLNYKGGTNYIGNHSQLMIDAEKAYAGFTSESWGASVGQTTEADCDPGPQTVGQFVQQANFRDSTNMPSALATIMTLLVLQMARPIIELLKQNAFLDLELLAIWG